MSKARHAAARQAGAAQLASLLTPEADGGYGFEAALASTGVAMRTPAQLRALLLSSPENGYWGQADVWFARDVRRLEAARGALLPPRRARAAQRRKRGERGGGAA